MVVDLNAGTTVVVIRGIRKTLVTTAGLPMSTEVETHAIHVEHLVTLIDPDAMTAADIQEAHDEMIGVAILVAQGVTTARTAAIEAATQEAHDEMIVAVILAVQGVTTEAVVTIEAATQEAHDEMTVVVVTIGAVTQEAHDVMIVQEATHVVRVETVVEGHLSDVA
jgi:hypothetical protein